MCRIEVDFLSESDSKLVVVSCRTVDGFTVGASCALKISLLRRPVNDNTTSYSGHIVGKVVLKKRCTFVQVPPRVAFRVVANNDVRIVSELQVDQLEVTILTTILLDNDIR